MVSTRSYRNPRRASSPPKKQTPLWRGPQEDGITFSLLSRFIECRERFRLKVIEGLVEDEGFLDAIEYGNMWHEAEEAFSRKRDYERVMRQMYARWRANYPNQEEETRKWYMVCKTTFPIYIEYWKQHQHEVQRTPILEEKSFSVKYVLPSGRWLKLRGKFDAIFGILKTGQLLLQENKSKNKMDLEGLQKTLDQDLQTMLYQIAMRLSIVEKKGEHYFQTDEGQMKVPQMKKAPTFQGVLYNVVKRPLSDMYAIRQRKTETETQFFDRLAQNIREDSFTSDGKAKRDSSYFHRWEINITEEEIDTFKNRVFDPLLEQLMDWWEWIQPDPFDPWRPRTYGEMKWHEFPDQEEVRNTFHWQSPWGVYNSLASGRRGSYFDLLTSNSKKGLHKATTLFPELQKVE